MEKRTDINNNLYIKEWNRSVKKYIKMRTIVD